MPANKSQKRYYAAFLILISGMWAVLYAIAPFQFDDFWFLPRNWAELGVWDMLSDGFDLSFYLCTHTDAGRIVNFASPLFLTMPRWLFGLLTAGCIWLILRFSTKLSASSEGGVSSYIILFAVIFFLPWYDFMLSTVFALNYVWSSALVLSAFCFLLKRIGGSHFSVAQSVLLIFLFFIAGWSHEGLSVPVFGGICLSFMLLRRVPDKLSCLFLVCFVLGIVMIAPSVLRRTEVAEMGYSRYVGLELIAHLILSNAVSLAFLLLLSWTLISKKLRQRLVGASFRNKFVIITSVGVVLTGTIINMFYYIAPRTAWGTILFGIIGSIQLLRLFEFRIGRSTGVVISVIAASCVVVNLSAAIFEQTKLTAEFQSIKQLYAESKDGTIFYDNIKPKLTPSLFKTSVRSLNQRHSLYSFSLGYAPHLPVTILPEILRNFDAAEAEEVPSFPHAMLFGGYVVMDDGYIPQGKTVVIIDHNGNRIESSYRLLPFKDSQDRQWQLLLPNVQLLSGVRISDISPRP